MRALLAPWPFLEGGATAVEVATIFDGATVEQRYLWHEGDDVARDPAGAPLVRRGANGFEVVLPRCCEGEVVVGRRAVDVRELTLCGVAAVPIGTRTRATLRVGAVTYVVAGTTAPRRLALGPTGSWRRSAALAATAVAACMCGGMLQWSGAPRRADWTIPDLVRTRLALLEPLAGGRAATAARIALEPPSVRTKAADAAAQATAAAKAAKAAAKAQAQTAAKAQAENAREQRQAEVDAQADAEANAQASQADAQAQATARTSRAAARAAASMDQLATLTWDDARRAAALQAQEAGIVGALAHARAAFLGDHSVSAATFADSGALALSSTVAANDAAAGGAAGGSAGGLGDAGGDLEGDQIGEAYGSGGIGLDGVGYGGGGGGSGDIGLGTIGLGTIGTIGTIGYGGGTGTGYGYGSGHDGLRGRVATGPVCTLAVASVRGSCDRDLVRRVVRAHINEVRFCYERRLQSEPTLTGRVEARFVVAPDGHVAASSASGMSGDVAACVAAAIARWQFARCVAEVHYPFVFVPIRGAP
ncbi:MAG: putative abductin-like protein [Myxococcales bacterium]|nr:putative abductin-like protein [Myxococcales bacterium]